MVIASRKLLKFYTLQLLAQCLCDLGIRINDVSRLFQIGDVVIELPRAVAPLGVAPAIRAEGLATLLGTAGNDGEGGRLAGQRRILEQAMEVLPGQPIQMVSSRRLRKSSETS